MRKNNIQLLFFILLFVAAASPYRAQATHISAMDLHVTYAGAGVTGCSDQPEYLYEVALTMYAACEVGPGGLGNQTSVRIQSQTLGLDTNLTVTDPTNEFIDQLCPTFSDSNSCRILANQQWPGYQKRDYTGLITLPPAPDYVISYSTCCRNGGINNLQTPLSRGAYIECGFNNEVRYNNSTPRFTTSPLPYVCVNQPFAYLNGPQDPNNDSLFSYTVTPLENNAAGLIPYVAGYSATDPVQSAASNPYTVNPVTATATFTPTTQGKFVLAFRCDEYERGTGVRLGYILRDVQINIFQCNTPPPPVDSLPISLSDASLLNTPNGKVLYACPGSNISFNVGTNSSDPNSGLYLESNNAGAIPGSNFTVTGQGTNSVSGNFTWTPLPTDLGEYTLIINAKDSTCTGVGFSLVLRSSTVIAIKIVPGLDAGRDLPICKLNPVTQQLFVRGIEPIYDFSWKDIDGGPPQDLSDPTIVNPTAKPEVTRVYTIETPNLTGACKNKDTVAVYIDTTNELRMVPESPLILCRPDYVQLNASITGKPPLDNIPCGVTKRQFLNEIDSVVTFGSPVYGPVGYDSLGGTSPTFANATRSAKQLFLINRKEMLGERMSSGTITRLTFDIAKNPDPLFAWSNFTIKMKCTNKQALSKGDGFEFDMIPVYTATGPTTFAPGTHSFDLDLAYDWDTTKNLLIEFCFSGNDSVIQCLNPVDPPVVRYSPTTYVSALSLTPRLPDGSPDTTAAVCDVLRDNGIIEKQARPNFRFTYSEVVQQQFPIEWQPGEFLSDNTIEHPLAYVGESRTYLIETYGRSGCILRDTLDIYVPEHNFKVLPEDTAICYDEGTPISAYGGVTYRWFEYENGQYKDPVSLSCDDCAEPFAQPKQTTEYRIVIGDSVWCYDTLKAKLVIMPKPDVRILNSDTTIKYGQRINLQATGGRVYNWSPVSSLNNPNISNPVATPTDKTRYIVGGLGTNGCWDFDTVYVTLDYRDNLFVPSAFSPNNDGKNDRFRIANLTFQRIMEFRVFNRWGQEVYSSNGNTGWDGSWKGVEQDMGNYSYLIKVGYPDGYVETYQGDITLIR